MSSMRYDKTDHGIMVHVAFGSPTDEEWRIYLDWVRSHRDVLKSVIVFVHNEGSLSATQRSSLAEVMKAMRPGFRSAVMTDSRVTRGILTALNWLTKKQDDTRAFPLAAFDEATVFIGASVPEKHAARALADKLGAFAKPPRAAAG